MTSCPAKSNTKAGCTNTGIVVGLRRQHLAKVMSIRLYAEMAFYIHKTMSSF